MKYVIEAEGEYLHWIVKCMDKGKLVELHRFYRAPEGQTYHRGKHGEHELGAMNALLEHFRRHPEVLPPEPAHPHVYTKQK